MTHQQIVEGLLFLITGLAFLDGMKDNPQRKRDMFENLGRLGAGAACLACCFIVVLSKGPQ